MRLSILLLAVLVLAGCGGQTTYGLNDFDTGARLTFKNLQEWRAGQKQLIDKMLEKIAPLENPLAERAIVVLPLRKQFEEKSMSEGFAAISAEALQTSAAMDEDLWFTFPRAITRRNIFEEIEVERSARATVAMSPNAGYLIWVNIDEKIYITSSERDEFLEFPEYVEPRRSNRTKAWLKDVEEYVIQNPVIAL